MLREILKQGRLTPLSIESQMAWLVACNDGLFDDTEPADISDQLEGDSRVTACIDGANVVEEAEKTLGLIINSLSELQAKHGTVSLTVIYHDPDSEQIVTAEVLPPL